MGTMRSGPGRIFRAALVAAALAATATAARAQEPRVVAISAKRFSFSPSEVHLTKGEAVTLRISSADVTHGMFMRALGIDAELAPGKTTEVTFTPQATGRFTAICDHFCGPGHGNMHMVFVVE
jgi:cytochrome c oxidase subunit II